MNRTTTLILLALVVLWWTTDVDAPAQGRPTQAYSPGQGSGPGHWWDACIPGVTYRDLGSGQCLPVVPDPSNPYVLR